MFRHQIVRPRRLGEKTDDLTYPYVTLTEALRDRARTTPDRIAFDFAEGTLTYRDLDEQSEDLARALFSRGVDRGGRCALVVPTGRDLIALVMAIIRLGAAPVLLDPGAPPAVVMRRIRDVRADVAVVERAQRDGLTAENLRVHSRIRLVSIDGLREPATAPRESDVVPSRDDLAAIVLTPGTAGTVHPVILRQRHVVSWANAVGAGLGIGDGDIVAAYQPLWLSAGFAWIAVLPVLAGCKLVHRTLNDGAAPWLSAMAEAGATVLRASDGVLRLLTGADGEAKLPSLRLAVIAGDAPRHGTIRDFEQRFGLDDVVRPGYALAEAVDLCAVVVPNDGLRLDDSGVVAAGRGLGGTEIRVVARDGRPAAAGEAGRVRVLAPFLFAGYFDDRMRTNVRRDDEWHLTEDIGYLDDDGTLFVLGREQDLIRLGDQVLPPRQVEEAASGVHNVQMVAAIGRTDRSEGGAGKPEQLVIVAEIAERAKEDRDQMKRISENLRAAAHDAAKVEPDEVLLVEPGVIPRNADGRIMYDRLRELVISGRLGREGAILHGGNVFVSPLKR